MIAWTGQSSSPDRGAALRTARLTTVGSLTAVLALGLSACGVSNEAGDADGGAGGGAEVDESFADCVPGSDSADAAAMEDDPDTEISIAAFNGWICLLYTSPSPRDVEESRMPSSA